VPKEGVLQDAVGEIFVERRSKQRLVIAGVLLEGLLLPVHTVLWAARYSLWNADLGRASL